MDKVLQMSLNRQAPKYTRRKRKLTICERWDGDKKSIRMVIAALTTN